MPSRSIYAVHDDALRLLQSLEARGPLQYVLTGAFDSTDTPVYHAAEEIPGLGTAGWYDTTSCDKYMVFRGRVRVVRRKVAQNAGGYLYFVDSWKNPPCIHFTCGGLYQDRCVITGSIEAGAMEGERANLFRQFDREARKQFVRVEAPGRPVFIGPAALELLRQGFRFTDSLGQEPDMDVTYEHYRPAARRQDPKMGTGNGGVTQ
jgi:hypothetical protein